MKVKVCGRAKTRKIGRIYPENALILEVKIRYCSGTRNVHQNSTYRSLKRSPTMFLLNLDIQ